MQQGEQGGHVPYKVHGAYVPLSMLLTGEARDMLDVGFMSRVAAVLPRSSCLSTLETYAYERKG